MATLRRLLCFVLAAVVLGGCQGGTTRTPPSTSASAAPTTTAVQPTTPPTTLSPRGELLAAYRRSWQVYGDALRRLDPSRLASAFADPELRAVRAQVARQKARHQPVRVVVELHPRVLLLTATDGVVDDTYINHMVVLDPATGKPAEPDPNKPVHVHYSFKRRTGTWKVVQIIEYRRTR